MMEHKKDPKFIMLKAYLSLLWSILMVPLGLKGMNYFWLAAVFLALYPSVTGSGLVWKWQKADWPTMWLVILSVPITTIMILYTLDLWLGWI